MIEQSFQRKELKSNKIRDRSSIGVYNPEYIYISPRQAHLSSLESSIRSIARINISL